MKNKLSISLKIAILVLIVSFLGIGIVAYFSYSQAQQIFISHTAEIISNNTDKYKDEIKSDVDKLKYNIEILTFNPSTKGFFRAYMDPYHYDEKTNRTLDDYEQDIITVMSLMMNQNPSYFQIRILDKNGNELIKLMKHKNKIIEAQKLQNKEKRAYFQQAMQYNDIYVSNINLNREFGEIEFPVKPTIRVAKSVIINGKKVGIIVINANIKYLFKFNKLKTKDIYTFITNSKGEYIFNPIHQLKEFGFEFGKNFNIFQDYPELKSFYSSNKLKFSHIDNKQIIEARKVYVSKHKFIVIIKIATTQIFKQKAQTYLNDLILFIVLSSLLIAIITTILVKQLTKPIEQLTQIAKSIAEGKQEKYEIDIKSNDEIGELAKAFVFMLDSLEKSQKELKDLANNLEKEVDKKTEELQKINENLQHLVDEKLKEVRQKDKLLLQQSKMAAMGEMIGAIAHQWRQPLNSLALNIQLLEDLVENNELTLEKTEEFVEKNMQTIEFMSQTIDDFRNFFRKDKEAVEFNLKEVIEKTITLQKAQLQDHNIKIETDLDDITIRGYKNEFMQVILNLISNSKDAIEERRKKIGNFEGKIYITSKKDNNKCIITLKDNGGGIPDKIKNRVFEPYFTTKEEGKGTGIGLYMVKEIIDRMNGKISFKNIDDGVEFKIVLNIDEGI